MNSDIARESVYMFPSEDALEVTMQVAKEVEEQMESYRKASLEKQNNLEEIKSHKKIVTFINHPQSKVADDHKKKSTEWKNAQLCQLIETFNIPNASNRIQNTK